MKYLLLTALLSVSCLTNAADDPIHTPVYLTHGNDIYQIHDNKAYKVEVVDGERYTTNHWFPLDQYGYTEEHVQKVKDRQAAHANKFIKDNRSYKWDIFH